MRVRALFLVVAMATVAGGVAAYAQAPAKKGEAKTPGPQVKASAAKAAAEKHVVLNSSDMQWGPGPDSLPPGAQVTVLDGDPGKAGMPFVMRSEEHTSELQSRG